MDKKYRHLQEQLEYLQAQLEDLSIDEASKAKLTGLVEDIEMELSTQGSGAGFDEEGGFRERIEELVSNFETEHPVTAGVLKDIMHKLASIGV
jgi:hypothetical protein